MSNTETKKCLSNGSMGTNPSVKLKYGASMGISGFAMHSLQAASTVVSPPQSSLRRSSQCHIPTPSPDTPPPKRKKHAPLDHYNTCRQSLPLHLHKHVKQGRTRRVCTYCAIKFEYSRKNDNGDSIRWDSSVTRTQWICSKCKLPLCKKCFHNFHHDD